jgi:hypothetical protein
MAWEVSVSILMHTEIIRKQSGFKFNLGLLTQLCQTDSRLVMLTEEKIKQNSYKMTPAVDPPATITNPKAITYTTHKTTGLTLHLLAYDLLPNITGPANKEPLLHTARNVTVLCRTTERQGCGTLHQHFILTNDNE